MQNHPLIKVIISLEMLKHGIIFQMKLSTSYFFLKKKKKTISSHITNRLPI